MNRYVISEMHDGEHGEVPGRTWVVEAPSRLAALREISDRHPGHGPIKIVDGPPPYTEEEIRRFETQESAREEGL